MIDVGKEKLRSLAVGLGRKQGGCNIIKSSIRRI